MNGCSIDYQLYSTVNMHCSKFAYFHRVGGWFGGWVDGRNLIIKTISAELDWAELGKIETEDWKLKVEIGNLKWEIRNSKSRILSWKLKWKIENVYQI